MSTGRKIKYLHFILLYSFVKKEAREFTSSSAVHTRCYWPILTKNRKLWKVLKPPQQQIL